MAFRFYEDFAEGEAIDLGRRSLSAEEIIEFATEFDPAPFHLSEEGGKNSMLGALSASGWQTCAILMRMMCDAFLLQSSSQGGNSVEECRWLAPVHAGDTLTGTTEILAKRLSASRPGVGILSVRSRLFKDSGMPVLTLSNGILMRTRP
jgi:acyl dehydratase